ncbi:hypothetical protein LMG3410_02103 [Achromobacter aegrifaciens]|uniref:hypothetical protein n=1 Tax=Achromobacter aegrifaciens TaxID=1287736 RepID=UPI0014695D4B|nr:hypothetical protein [Achromobacter aegrifaciens]CAB3857461.1 hypothetical protein LMG3410_02103 [Achromobacter aegrifaciens]
MSAPESTTSADQALSSLLGAALNVPHPDAPASQVSAVEQREVLPPLDENLRLILGRPNFACGQLAQMLRLGGQEIERRAEHEQAAVIYFLLKIYLKHGNGWAEKASDAFAAIAAQQGKGGEA